jgi:hypothetical protein
VFRLLLIIIREMETVGSAQEKIYRICESPGKGMGMFANRNISRGELIIAEKPLIVLNGQRHYTDYSTQLNKKLKKLSNSNRDIYFALRNEKPLLNRAMGIYATNSLPMEDPVSGVFPFISRINHSCLRNVHHHWNETKGLETVYALKDIEINQEILTCYTEARCDKESRKRKLIESFNFECKCELCSIEDEKTQKLSDLRRNLIYKLDSEIPQIALFQMEKAFEQCYTVHKLYIEEGLDYDAAMMGNLFFCK